MTEILNNRKVFSLLEVTSSIQKTIADRYASSFWVKAEMNKLNYYKLSGHCYPDIVEKQNGKIVAQIKSHLWREDYLHINNNFLKVLKEPLKDGIKILFLAKVSFDPAFGLALQILDIDPSYTLGDLELEKQETIKKLQTEGIFNRNKTLILPLLPQRIAIISVESSKGYADFIEVIEVNPWNYKFFHLLFPSILQGEKAIEGIMNQLNNIRKLKHHFDVVAILRGGGGDVGLSCYNDYQLSKEIALFPIPIITGIGHSTNETVAEMISHSNSITPTKLAEYLIQKFHNFSVPVQSAKEIITDKSKRMILDERFRFRGEIKLFRFVTDHILLEYSNEIRGLMQTVFQQSKFMLKHDKAFLISISENIKRGISIFCMAEKKELTNIEKNIRNMSPGNVLKRGYSITLLNGKAVKNYDQVAEGDLLNNLLFNGSIISIVKSANKPDNNE